jgi:hypothetical protein
LKLQNVIAQQSAPQASVLSMVQNIYACIVAAAIGMRLK